MSAGIRPSATDSSPGFATQRCSWRAPSRRRPSRVSRSDGQVAVRGAASYARAMCRNISTRHNFAPPATQAEGRAAALQYVRKLSGSATPSQANRVAFEAAVDAVAAASEQLLAHLTTSAPPKNREVEAAKGKARSAARYAA